MKATNDAHNITASKRPLFNNAGLDASNDDATPLDLKLGPEDLRFLRKLREERSSDTSGRSRPSLKQQSSVASLDERRELSPRTVRKLEQASEEHELEPSIWDSAARARAAGRRWAHPRTGLRVRARSPVPDATHARLDRPHPLRFRVGHHGDSFTTAGKSFGFSQIRRALGAERETKGFFFVVCLFSVFSGEARGAKRLITRL